MSGAQGLNTVQGIVDALNQRLSDLQQGVSVIQKQWSNLGKIGGQRDDHAAELLAKLLPDLREIQRFSGAVIQQVEGIRRKPFGE